MDAKTFLAVPYPKYDTNTGLTINAKIKDKNLIGTFASLDGDVYALFEDGVWNNPKLSGEFKITDLLIGDTVFSFNLKGSGYLKDLDPSYSASTSIRKIPFLFGSYFDLAASIEKSGEGWNQSLGHYPQFLWLHKVHGNQGKRIQDLPAYILRSNRQRKFRMEPT